MKDIILKTIAADPLDFFESAVHSTDGKYE
jgi:hypothetical protein